jgi:hypothetical protein
MSAGDSSGLARRTRSGWRKDPPDQAVSAETCTATGSTNVSTTGSLSRLNRSRVVPFTVVGQGWAPGPSNRWLLCAMSGLQRTYHAPAAACSGAAGRGHSLPQETGKGKVLTMSTPSASYWVLRRRNEPDSAFFRNFPLFTGLGMQFESHLGHSVFAGQSPVFSLGVDKPPKVLASACRFRAASIRKRGNKDGSSTYLALWRYPKSREQQGLTVATLVEAETLKRLLDANGQSFEIAQHAILSSEKRTPTVAEVIQEHIDLLIRPSSGRLSDGPAAFREHYS